MNKKISKTELQKILESHGKWLRGENGGQRADLRNADLQGADLQGAYLPNGMYQIVGCGCHNRCTTYDSINDRVICGCWDDKNGNHLASFKQRIEDTYGEDGGTPDTAYYVEYMAAIKFFEMVNQLKKSVKQEDGINTK